MMKSLRWRLTIITSVLLALICIVLNTLIYSNGIYYIDLLGSEVIDISNRQDNLLINIDEEYIDEFVSDFSIEVIDTKNNFKNISYIITAIVAIVGGIITYFVSGRTLRPLKEFSNQVEKVQLQNLTDYKIDTRGIREFEQLSESYNRMLKRLDNSFNIQKQFSGNVAHELKTPLAIMQMELDTYYSSSANDIDAKATLGVINEQCERLNDLIKTLLTLSKLESIRYEDKININDIIEEVVEDLDVLINTKNININIKDNDKITIIGSDILMYRMIYNLAENAIKYNDENGVIDISIKKTNQGCMLEISDSGKGITDEDKKMVFKPFFRVDKSRNRELGGVGLGLALVSEIVRCHGGKISVENNNPKGSTFKVFLPNNIIM